jgi:hypothetical protein
MFPEIGYAEDAVCADEGPFQALRLIGIARDDFHTERGERLGLFRIGLAGIARTVNGLSRSARIAQTNPPPCAPVAPIIAMISFFGIIDSPGYAGGLCIFTFIGNAEAIPSYSSPICRSGRDERVLAF